MSDLALRGSHVVRREGEIVRDQLVRNQVALINGSARFVGPHSLVVSNEGSDRSVRARNIVIACGSHPARPSTVDFDGEHIVDADDLLRLQRIPTAMVVVGAGVIGMEYASMLAAIGTHVTVVDSRDEMLEFCDREIVESLQYSLRELGVVFRFGEHVAAVERQPSGAIVLLASGKAIAADTVLYATGRQGAVDGLNLEQAGLQADDRGHITVDDQYRTIVPHIYAVGDVVGFPALAATSIEQGRQAAHHALGEPIDDTPALAPIGIYTIPEISYVGRTEADLTKAAIPYEVGIARYRELARGQIAGDPHGLLKLLVHRDDHTLLGVHICGTEASELIHIGLTAMSCDAKIELLVDAIYNYPTFAEAYKVAALDAANKLRVVQRMRRRLSSGRRHKDNASPKAATRSSSRRESKIQALPSREWR
jgi:NAD(P) transhydrogenase